MWLPSGDTAPPVISSCAAGPVSFGPPDVPEGLIETVPISRSGSVAVEPACSGVEAAYTFEAPVGSWQR